MTKHLISRKFSTSNIYPGKFPKKLFLLSNFVSTLISRQDYLHCPWMFEWRLLRSMKTKYSFPLFFLFKLWIQTQGQFHQHFLHVAFMHKDPKSVKIQSSQQRYLFVLLRSAKEKAFSKILIKFDPKRQFLQQSLSSFYARRSQKHQKDKKLWVFFEHLGSARVKAACRL